MKLDFNEPIPIVRNLIKEAEQREKVNIRSRSRNPINNRKHTRGRKYQIIYSLDCSVFPPIFYTKKIRH